MTQGVVLTIDGREVEVAPGTGLVEAAEELGIEVPVFCYEPRLGPAVGACRMCLVEIEGMPKLQTACSTTVRPGMVVSTVGHRAREAQEAVLEFLLVNHPLDCPVCDKGGECPLQDHAFRWGPGASRFLELKRNSDKPIPISPLIALDRERCILCYRCTRFSSDVAQDGQLISRERGANSIIATFEGRPYEGHFSGNVIELCPVGALTSTEYRFKGRPWEVVDHPTVCSLCPVGCNTFATVREGAVARVLARQNDAVDEGWLCDRGRFTYPGLQGDARIVVPVVRRPADTPVARTREAAPTAVSHEGAMEWLYQHLAWEQHTTWGGRDMRATWVLSGGETCEEAWLIRRIADATGGTVVAVEGGSAALPHAPARIQDLDTAKTILVLGDIDVADAAPILDLRIRKALRDGAKVWTAGIGGSRLEPAGASHVPVTPGNVEAFVQDLASGNQKVAELAEALGSGPTVVVFPDGLLSQQQQETLAARYGLDGEGSGLLGMPATANARGLAAVGIEPATREALERPGGLVLWNVDPSRAWLDVDWDAILGRASWTAAVATLPNDFTEVADIIIPAANQFERDGTIVNLEGRLQRLAAATVPPEGIRPQLSWLGGMARRLGIAAPSQAAAVYAAMQRGAEGELAGTFPAATYAEIPAEGLPGVAGGTLAVPVEHADLQASGPEVVLHVAPMLYDAPEVEHTPRMQFLRDQTVVRLSREDGQRLGVARGEQVKVWIGQHSFAASVAMSSRIMAGYARVGAGTPGVPASLRGYHVARVERVTVAQGAAAE